MELPFALRIQSGEIKIHADISVFQNRKYYQIS